jgi:hypothetical protein
MKRLSVHVEMADGRVLEATTATRDYILYENTARRQKPPWGAIQDNPSQWEAFVSWAALRRTGKYTAGFETFLDEVDMVDANSEEAVDPTNQEVGDA